MAYKQKAVGMNQWEMWDIFKVIRLNFNAMLAKLDLDAGVTDTNYAATLSIVYRTQFARVAIQDQGEWLKAIDAIRTAFNALLTKLDADVAVDATDYAATLVLFDLTNVRSLADLLDAGINQGALLAWFDVWEAKNNGLMVKFDADTGMDTDYPALHFFVGANYYNLIQAKLKAA